LPTRHDKLIRDRIPEIMDEAGVGYEVETLDADAFERALRAKLVEEAREAADADDPNELAKELADLLEVADALMAATGLDPEHVERLRQRRKVERGGFERKLWLATTER